MRQKSWIMGQVTVANMMKVGGFAFAIAGFYFVTNARLETQARDLAVLARDISDIKRDTTSERDRVRTEITDRAEKTATAVADLSKAAAVQGAQLTAIREDLAKVGQQITNLATAPLPSAIGCEPR